MNQFKLKDYVYPKKLPWTAIIDDINKTGIPLTQISILVGANWSTFQKWRQGTEPKHSIGVAILILHTRYCGEPLTNQRVSEAG